MDIPYYHYDHGGDGQYLPPGFRFHPTDEELITHYLLRKVLDGCFSSRAIAEVDLNKCEPWQLPGKAKMGEKEWYFFSLRDRKYPTGLRTNRATEAGYWKATGKDREIYSTKTSALVGMKKTLVFYKGRAPKGEKSNWVMHEYRLEGKFSYHFVSRSSKDEWVISRVFKKTGLANTGLANTGASVSVSSGASNMTKIPSRNYQEQQQQQPSSPCSVSLPPLLDPIGYTDNSSCSYDGRSTNTTVTATARTEHVSCFSTTATTTTALGLDVVNVNKFDHLLPAEPVGSFYFDPFPRFVSRDVSVMSNIKPFHESFNHFPNYNFGSMSMNSSSSVSLSSTQSGVGVSYWLPAMAEDTETKAGVLNGGLDSVWNY
ncbi:unnamed protein product [Cochlearia groenlandica]